MGWFDVPVVKKPARALTPAEQKGHILQKGERPAGANIITRETSLLMHARRKELTTARALEGQRRSAEKNYAKVRKGEVPKAVSDLDAWELANEMLADAFYGSTSAKSMSDVFSTMGRATGILGERGEKSEHNDAVPGADSEGARILYQIIFNVEKGNAPKLEDIIDIEPTDARTN